MATGKRYYWIKLKESFMTSDTVDFLMEQPNGANYVVLYQMLCLKTINTEGKLSRQIGEIIIPYDVEKIARDCKWFSVDTVRVAMNLYKAIGLIYEDKDGALVLADHKNLVGSETDYAEKNRRIRANERAALLASGHNVSSDVSENVSTDNRDKISDIRDKDIRVEDAREEREDTTPQAEEVHSCPFSKIRELYHCICVSFPRIKSIDGNRKNAVAARWRTSKSIETFRELFSIAEASPFLKGQNDRNWSADFDWMMKATNFSKILEHRYDERNADAGKSSGVFGTLQRMYEEASSDDQEGSS